VELEVKMMKCCVKRDRGRGSKTANGMREDLKQKIHSHQERCAKVDVVGKKGGKTG